MDITFNIPETFDPSSPGDLNASALRALLDCLIQLNRAYIRAYSPLGLYHSGVRYGRTKVWETIPALHERGYGDCKSLTCALIAEYREQGKAAVPCFRWIKNERGGTDFHILVQTNEGFEDPSKELGMGKDENRWFRQG